MFINMFRLLHPMFEGEGGGGGSSESTPAPAPADTVVTPVTPAATAPVETTPTVPAHNPLRPETVKTETTPTVEEIDLGGRKVKVTDPVIRDIAKDYKELTGTLTKESQRVKQLEDDLRIERAKQTPIAPATPTPEPVPVEPAKPTPERMQEINDKYLEMAYEDPFGAQVWLNQQPEYQQLISPIQKQQVENVLTETQQADKARKDGLNQMRETMESKYPDFKEMVPHMQKAIEMFPSLGEKLANAPSVESLEEAYRAAKLVSGNNTTTPATPATPTNPVVQEQPKTLEQMLADPEVIKQIIANPQITSTIISDYIKGVNGSQQNIPVMIGNQPGGAPTAIPPMEYKNTKEAGKGFRDWMRRNSTG